MPRSLHVAAALAAGLALADASIVVLALPPVLAEFQASVEGVAAVIGAYTLALAVSLPAAVALIRGRDPARAGAVAMAAFAAAAIGCGLAPDLGVLIAFRAVQGIAAGAVLVAAFELLGAGEERGAGGPPVGRRTWVAAAVVGAALGPALGGVLTELFDWRAIFLAQAPLLGAGALICARARWEPAGRGPAAAGGPVVARGPAAGGEPVAGRQPVNAPAPALNALCLGLLSAALTGVLFLLVLLLISGWALSPLAAAAVVSILPAAAFAGTRVPGAAGPRAVAGCALVGAGVLCLAFLPVDSVGLTVVPQVVAGLGMGMALPALAGGLLPERTAGDAARLLAVRHLGITLALALLAPIAAAQLDEATEQVRMRGTALILDARLPALDKLDLAAVATGDLETIAPRAQLRNSLEPATAAAAAGDRPAYAELRERADDTLITAVNDAFAPAFLVCGALALLAACGLLVTARPRLGRAALAGCAVAVAIVPAQAAVANSARPPEVVIADPCRQRSLPGSGGLDGLVQNGAVALLDDAACRHGATREELALALVDDGRARRYRREHGVDPRDTSELLGPGLPWGVLDRLLSP